MARLWVVDYDSIGLRITLRLVLAQCRVGPLARLGEDYYSIIRGFKDQIDY